jgi:NitT/TauT family transport system ATP-binding protein
VLFVTHSIREAVLLSDRILVMGRSPSRILAEVAVPFARPRTFDLGESPEFNELCGLLRQHITAAREGIAVRH